jgi:hypothetical protein
MSPRDAVMAIKKELRSYGITLTGGATHPAIYLLVRQRSVKCDTARAIRLKTPMRQPQVRWGNR